MAVTGTLVAESLAPGMPVECGLTLRKVQRISVSSPADDQPAEWTLLEFSCPEDVVGQFAQQLADAMRAGSWYCDFASARTKYVVFSGRVFAFDRHDAVANAEAVEHARSVGVPEAQLDWPL
ncbi:hypothetical protein HDA40_002100 [Hamadaea flava]|uniref:Uncharacterized protein n=1 Tax=Hamadaea flava TaxID=1742688 RepID=A0ABV8LLF2_9ACTN|nr:hypothetical protein [Hamadaea flava]MCP2323593.1 hypothetical protein [Hamadaea flava]